MLNGHSEQRLPNTLNVSFPGVSGRDLLHAVAEDVAVSVGSACHSDAGTVSGVLAAMGIGFDRAGQMKIDDSVFNKAVDSDPEAVQELFAGASDGTTDGAFDDLSDIVSTYADAGGLVKKAQTRIDDQVKQISGRMDVLDAQLAIRRNALQAEFIAADQAMSQLNSQVNSLTSLSNQYRLF